MEKEPTSLDKKVEETKEQTLALPPPPEPLPALCLFKYS